MNNDVKEKQHISDPTSWVLFIFVSQMWVTVYDLIFGFKNESYILIGLLFLVSLPFYFVAGDMYHKLDDKVSGNLYYASGFLFAGPVAIDFIYSGVVSCFFPNITYDGRIIAIMYGVFALWGISTIPYYLKQDKLSAITWISFMLWFIPLFLNGFLSSSILNSLSILLCLISTIGSTCIMIYEVKKIVRSSLDN